MTEYGIFEDGLCIEAGFYEREEAEKRMRAYSADPKEDGYTVEEICPEHEDQPRHGCEECNSEDWGGDVGSKEPKDDENE